LGHALFVSIFVPINHLSLYSVILINPERHEINHTKGGGGVDFRKIIGNYRLHNKELETVQKLE